MYAPELQETGLQDMITDVLPNGDTWYNIDPTKVFNANLRSADDGACNGHWKDEKFMHPPYITMDGNSISAAVTAEAVGTKACVSQNTKLSCNFSLGNSAT